MPLTFDGRWRKGEFVRAAADLYPTRNPLAEPLPLLEDLGPRVWEPACGHGDLARVLLAAGLQVVATDKYAWGYGREGADFLKTRRLLAPVICTNPPFSLWREFAEHALSLRPRLVVLLGRTLLQEGAGIGRVFDRNLVRVWQSRRRVNLAPSHKAVDMVDKGHNTKLAFAWYVLQPDKPAELGDGYTVRGFVPAIVSRPKVLPDLA